MPRKAWDSSIHDLSVHRISRAELEARRERLRSPNAPAARRELHQRRATARESLSALCDDEDDVRDEATDALRELAAVENELQRLVDDARDAPAAVRHERPEVTALAPLNLSDEMNAASGDDCATPPTPLEPSIVAPWAVPRNLAPRWADAADELTNQAAGGGAERVLPVVDLEDEIALFRQRTDQRLAALGPSTGGAPAAARPQTPAPSFLPPDASEASATSRPVASGASASAIPAKPSPANRDGSVAVAPTRASAARSPQPMPPWRPANGKLRLEQPPRLSTSGLPDHTVTAAVGGSGASGVAGAAAGGGNGGGGGGGCGGARSPDTLGLSRMQHACGELHELVAAYESSRAHHEQVQHAEARAMAAAEEADGMKATTNEQPPAASAPTRASGGGSGALRRSAIKGPNGALSYAPPSSYSGCNMELVEISSKLVGFLHRSDAELREQAQMRAHVEAKLSDARAALERQADETTVELASLRRELRLIKEEHAAQLATLCSQVAAVQAATEHQAAARRSQVTGTAPEALAATPPQAVPQAMSQGTSSATQQPAEPNRRAPSLFQPLASPPAVDGLAERRPRASAERDLAAAQVGDLPSLIPELPTPPRLSPAAASAVREGDLASLSTPPTIHPQEVWPPSPRPRATAAAADLAVHASPAAAGVEDAYRPREPLVAPITVSTVGGLARAAAGGVVAAVPTPLVLSHQKVQCKKMEGDQLSRSTMASVPASVPLSVPTSGSLLSGGPLRVSSGLSATPIASTAREAARESTAASSRPREKSVTYANHTPPSRPAVIVSEAVERGLPPDRVAEAEMVAQTNEARSQALLQAYYDEKQSRRRPPTDSSIRAAATGGTLTATQANGRLRASGPPRASLLTIEPTRLFATDSAGGWDSRLEDAADVPRTRLPQPSAAVVR